MGVKYTGTRMKLFDLQKINEKFRIEIGDAKGLGYLQMYYRQMEFRATTIMYTYCLRTRFLNKKLGSTLSTKSLII